MRRIAGGRPRPLARLNITSDGPAAIRLSGCARTVSVPAAGGEVAH